ncbi:hypothetical protein QEJ31_09355 [Pigmentibacter sp. JX0631]|uniref:hypothetical protein n=1 Tax=Pigmentibacter sp. JX0631 TaxID=2976982 RepID=UPI002469213F|nr:hypothetical protein [Pigmentibacter sp. JX0631]WGL58735.1 hypothetical protein QEJ31_09355 [Pigmentibacter sp. JX0631]
MPIFQDLKQYVRSENANDRYNAIEKLVKNSQSWQGNLLIWQIMSLIPTQEEKSKLASSLSLPSTPSSEWAIISYLLLKETNASVLSSCIMALANSKISSFSHRIKNLLEKHTQVDEILYAIYHYIEQTSDERFISAFENSFHDKLPDYILSKGFNTFLSLGYSSIKANKIAISILENERNLILKSNSAISALLYLGFSLKIDELNSILNKLINTKLIRVSQLIYNQISYYQSENFNQKSAKDFIYNNANNILPNFTGFNCFNKEILAKSLQEILVTETNFENLLKILCVILKLKDPILINILAQDPKIGLINVEKLQPSVCKIWGLFKPYASEIFNESITNPENFNIWHKLSNDLNFTFLNYDNFFLTKKTKDWQNLFEKNCDIDLLLAQVFALGNINTDKYNLQNYILHEKIVLSNIKMFHKKNGDIKLSTYDRWVDKIYSATIGGSYSTYFMNELYKTIPFSGTSWAFTAIALSAPKLDLHTISLAIQSELETIRNTLISGNMEKDEYILEVTSRFQSILVGANQFRVPITQKTLETLKDISNLIQSILDNTSQQTEEENDSDSSDWNGNYYSDRPIMRWGAILQVCLNSNLSGEEKDFYEKFIREGLRVAPHVEKRWIVRALVKLDSDDAIKAILYQALQHIDIDFVEHTIVELLKSKHPRAHQALIRLISKPSISDEIKIKIINEIPLVNPEEILQEFKTLQFMRLNEKVDTALQYAIKKIIELIPPQNDNSIKNDQKISSQDIDLVIKSFIPNSTTLSIDSKSALRTAEMILIQSKEWGNEAVDLSPIVNMHCKAVELTMRDTFEAYTDSIIRKGELSKRLDSIGYGKGIVEKMTAFEEYIANLPTIRTIPYFSKFKLRKMLRAICLYRPGKRFTLDGPKAFALLLLVASRQECQFQLNKIISLNFSDDIELFEFIKLVHSLQDSRNRAVHEGLTWEARDEIETMRHQAYKIISTCLTIGRNLEAQTQ